MADPPTRPPTAHLSDIETVSILLRDAQSADATLARQQLLEMYYGPAFRYLLATLRDQHVAEELVQNFAIKLMQGDYVRHVDRQRGRFRDYLKRSLRNLAIDYQRRGKGPQPLPEDSGAWSPLQAEGIDEEAFFTRLREELVRCAWKSLEQVQQETGTHYHAVLYLKSESPELRSAQLAERLSAKLGKSFSEAGVRQLLHRAREKFAELLLAHVERCALLDHSRHFASEDAAEVVEELLTDLKLLPYCKPALDKRRPGNG